jgi:mannose-6-phosphate isomerase-like protein (cupin superfamily)
MQKPLTRQLTILIIFGFLLVVLIAGGQSPRTASVQSLLPSTAKPGGGYVLRANEGEILQRGKGNTVTIKVDPKTGSPSMAIGTQLLDAGVGIPVHMHEHEDEVLFVHEGGGVAVLGGERKVIGKGDTVYIPHGVWHGVETKDTGVNLLWVVTPPGLEGFFREISSPLGAPPKVLTPAQIEDIGRKHGVRFKPR